MNNQVKTSRPNEHRAWFIDKSVIDFLWAKGWKCRQAEACDWWYQLNENLKKEFFPNELEWKNFKKKGIYPAKHHANWAKLTAQEQAEITQECWDSQQNRWYPEKLLTYTLVKLKKGGKDG